MGGSPRIARKYMICPMWQLSCGTWYTRRSKPVPPARIESSIAPHDAANRCRTCVHADSA